MPTATYSWRAMSANSRTRSGSRSAASPRAPATPTWRPPRTRRRGLGEGMPRVGAHRDRDRMRGGRREFLQGVRPRHGSRVLEGVHVDMVHLLVQDQLGGRGAGHRPVALDQGALRADLDDLVEHQAGLLGQRQPSDEVFGPFRRALVAGPRTAPSADHGRGPGRSFRRRRSRSSAGVWARRRPCVVGICGSEVQCRRVRAISVCRPKAGPIDGSRSQIAAKRSDPQTGQGLDDHGETPPSRDASDRRAPGAGSGRRTSPPAAHPADSRRRAARRSERPGPCRGGGAGSRTARSVRHHAGRPR